MKKGTKIKPEEIIAIFRQVEMMISQWKIVSMSCRDSGITKNPCIVNITRERRHKK